MTAPAWLDDADGVAHLLDSLRQTDASEQTGQVLARDPAAHVSLDNPTAATRRLSALYTTGTHEQVTTRATRYARSPGAAQIPAVSSVSRSEERRRQ
ncbi:hypothetical protein MUK60_00270 [Streptomyces sp. LRE541]|uniref:hypothetical protein n=1 Tax=Streptomyces sp. LRE541 TaxID=2931983 RepID=UPI00200C29D8|nr:hypothetical protein [Streptomyces sp. LRE541]UPZ26390.1 hypothetical protein MUK60_00270 [Streptomyces sp. LRE541]